jgi:hypothetical protein
MKTIPFAQAYKLLNDASAIIWDDHHVDFPCCDDADHGEFLYLSYTDGNGFVFEHRFNVDDNLEVKIEDCNMYLKNSEGDIVKIEILWSKNIELELDNRDETNETQNYQ